MGSEREEKEGKVEGKGKYKGTRSGEGREAK